MSYSSRHRYTSRREKNERLQRHIRVVIIIAFLALLVWTYKNRVWLWDYLETYFY